MSIEAPPTTMLPARIEGRADVLGMMKALLAGYSGTTTIVRELAQNTDDVPGDDERWLEFHFHPDRLVIKNSTVFRDADFRNITNIAYGGKSEEQHRTIGAFGVGFVSVYQLTDTPIVRSSGHELRMQPGLNDFPIDQRSSDVVKHTEFELPFRRRRTVVGTRLEMPPVTDQWIHDILQQLPDETYRLLFFLRCLCRIAVYHNGQRISEVCRTITADPQGCERITLDSTRGQETTRHTWLRFSGTVPGVPEKDSRVQVVIPDADVPDSFLHSHCGGRLYNYLPTDIATGLPFQINGDFFPSTDRKSIDNDHRNHHDWNERVIKALGCCVASALPQLLTRFHDEPLKLYRRIAIGTATELVKPIADALVKAARELRIFCTPRGWLDRAETCWTQPQIRVIAEDITPNVMSAELQAEAWPLLQRLSVREFTFADALAEIGSNVTPGTALADAPPYLRSRAQVAALVVL